MGDTVKELARLDKKISRVQKRISKRPNAKIAAKNRMQVRLDHFQALKATLLDS